MENLQWANSQHLLQPNPSEKPMMYRMRRRWGSWQSGGNGGTKKGEREEGKKGRKGESNNLRGESSNVAFAPGATNAKAGPVGTSMFKH